MSTPRAARALQHLFSSVERGHRSSRGRGFQTAAASPELVGTEDLAVLERAACYSIRSERRAAGDLPTRETFFSLPSGRLALGRTVDCGADSMGRAGNYLCHHLVLECEAFLDVGADPFAVLDSASLAVPGTDLTPRDLPALEVAPGDSPGPGSGLEALPPGMAAGLVAAALEPRERTVLLLGDDRRSRETLRGVLLLVPPEDRPRLSFCTHFHDSHHLRGLFRLAAVSTSAEVPAHPESYQVFVLDGPRDPTGSPRTPAAAATPYAAWLVDCARRGAWDEVRDFNRTAERLRRGVEIPDLASLPPRARRGLWEREPAAVAAALRGRPDLAAFLKDLPDPGSIADRLLSWSPEDLAGPLLEPGEETRCLAALRAAATPAEWRQWLRRWRDDPRAAPFLADLEGPWKRLARRLSPRNRRGNSAAR